MINPPQHYLTNNPGTRRQHTMISVRYAKFDTERGPFLIISKTSSAIRRSNKAIPSSSATTQRPITPNSIPIPNPTNWKMMTPTHDRRSMPPNPITPAMSQPPIFFSQSPDLLLRQGRFDQIQQDLIFLLCPRLHFRPLCFISISYRWYDGYWDEPFCSACLPARLERYRRLYVSSDYRSVDE